MNTSQSPPESEATAKAKPKRGWYKNKPKSSKQLNAEKQPAAGEQPEPNQTPKTEKRLSRAGGKLEREQSPGTEKQRYPDKSPKVGKSPRDGKSTKAKPTPKTGSPQKAKKPAMNPTAKVWIPSSHTSPENSVYDPVAPASYHETEYPLNVRPLIGWPAFPREPEQQSQVTQPQVTKPQVTKPQETPSPGSMALIMLTSEYMAELRAFLHPAEELKSVGYVLETLTPEELEAKRRCSACNKLLRKLNHKKIGNRSARESPAKTAESQETKQIALQSRDVTGNYQAPVNLTLNTDSGPAGKKVGPNGHPDADSPPPKNICHFHPGDANRWRRIWTCCGKALHESPCQGAPEHSPMIYAPGQLEAQWLFHETPHIRPEHANKIRPAVAIDCEMGTTKEGETELIRVTLLDYFTGAALVDSLVYPDVTIDNYNSRYSGVTYGMMVAAKKQNNCFLGRDNARKAVWEYVGPDTIVIGHSAYNDLKSMRWIHHHLVDSFLLEPQPVERVAEKDECTGQQGEQKRVPVANGKTTSPGKVPTTQPSKPVEPSTLSKTPAASGAEAQEGQKPAPPKPKTPKGSGPRALKTLARVKLGREIQNAGRLGHDSFEDALAARDLVHWAVLDRRQHG